MLRGSLAGERNMLAIDVGVSRLHQYIDPRANPRAATASAVTGLMSQNLRRFKPNICWKDGRSFGIVHVERRYEQRA